MKRSTATLRFRFVAAVVVLASAFAASAAERTVPPRVAPAECAATAREIVDRLAAEWRGAEEMVFADELSFGIRVSGEGGGELTVTLSRERGARVTEGQVTGSRATFVTDLETLRAIDRGEINVMTAMARARAADPAPLTVEFPAGFRWTPALQALYLPLTFHFFNRGVPEVVRFGEGTSLPVHGAKSTILYYDRGLRTSWYQLDSGMHINADPADQKNHFSSIVIVTRGAMRSRIGGVERILREGEAVLVPEEVAHEFWAGKGDYAEFVLVMFGEKA